MTMLRLLRSQPLQWALRVTPRSTASLNAPQTRSISAVLKKKPSQTTTTRTARTTVRTFHATPLQSLAAMRRRRRGSPAPAVVTRSSSQAHDYDSDDDDNDEDEVVSASRGLLHKTVDDPVAFLKGADTLLDKIQEAMEPMKRANDYFFITRGTEEDMGDFLLIDLGPLLGQYTLQIALDERCLLFQSPISGQFTYKLSENKGEWCGEDDGHAFEGLLVRDLIRQVNGIPNL